MDQQAVLTIPAGSNFDIMGFIESMMPKVPQAKDTKPKTLAEFSRLRPEGVAIHVEIGSNDILIPWRGPDTKAAIRVDGHKAIKVLSPMAKQLLVDADKMSFLSKLEIYMAAQVFGKGPKVFRPTAEQLFALEHMKLNIEVMDFHSPFETFVVELPHEYSKARTHSSERAANFSFFHRRKNPDFFVHSLIYDETSMKGYWMPKAETALVEEWFEWDSGGVEADEKEMYIPGDIIASMSEFKLELLVRRAVTNYCLLLDEVGTKVQGPASPNQYSQLVKWCQKNNVHTKKNKIQLAAQPIIYKMKAAPTPLVRVMDASVPHKGPGSTGRTMPYHIRRGHYRMQPCGPKQSERKRIRVAAVVVNPHLAPGLPTTQEYKT